jgi:hypothetical protein
MTKYGRHGDFLEMVRKIDCYDRLVANRDIIEVSKNSMKSSSLIFKPDEIVELFSSLLRANYGNPLLLISPTAQKEIEHFLDDEASKDSAVKSSAVSALGIIIQPKFETLATQMNSKGEECYDEHTIAEALGIQFSDLRKITDRLQKANEIHGQDFICTVKAGFTTKEVESRLYNLDDTKLIVTQFQWHGHVLQLKRFASHRPTARLSDRWFRRPSFR